MLTKKNAFLLFISISCLFYGIQSCTNEKNGVLLDPDLFDGETNIQVQQLLQDLKTDSPPSYPMRLLFAKETTDGVLLYGQTESGIANYILEIQYSHGEMTVNLTLGQDSLSQPFQLSKQQMILNQPIFQVGDNFIGKIELQGRHPVLNEEIIVVGDFNLKIQNKNYNLSKARAAKRLDRFYNLAAVRPEEVKSIDLTNLDMTDLLPELAQFKNMERLELAYNQLDESAFAILCQLPNLKYLSLSRNQVTMIPPEINCLKNLEELNLQYNKINRIPQALQYLKKLEMLNLQFNEIEAVPEEIEDLTALKVLLLTGNPIEDFPVEIIEQARIKEIHLPDSIFIQNVQPIIGTTNYKYHSIKGYEAIRLFIKK